MNIYGLVEKNDAFNNMVLKEHIEHYVDKYRNECIKCISKSESSLEKMKKMKCSNRTLDDNGNDNLDEFIKLHTNYIKKWKTQMLLYGCIEKFTSHFLVTKIMDKINIIYNDELEHIGELVESAKVYDRKRFKRDLES